MDLKLLFSPSDHVEGFTSIETYWFVYMRKPANLDILDQIVKSKGCGQIIQHFVQNLYYKVKMNYMLQTVNT